MPIFGQAAFLDRDEAQKPDKPQAQAHESNNSHLSLFVIAASLLSNKQGNHPGKKAHQK